MPQIIRCPHCQKSMQAPDNVAGKRLQCPSCKKPFQVPGVAAPTAPAKPAPPAAAQPSTIQHQASVTGEFQAVQPRPSNGDGAKPVPTSTPTKCPSCNAQLLEGA